MNLGRPNKNLKKRKKKKKKNAQNNNLNFPMSSQKSNSLYAKLTGHTGALAGRLCCVCVCAVGCICRRRDVACRSCVVRPLTPSARILGTRLALDGRWDLFIYLFIYLVFGPFSISAGHLLVVKQAPAPVSLSPTAGRVCLSYKRETPSKEFKEKQQQRPARRDNKNVRRIKRRISGWRKWERIASANDRWKVDPT